MSDPALISIHVPLAGHDARWDLRQGYQRISIHKPLAGHDGIGKRSRAEGIHFNPHAPCGARRALVVRYLRAGVISIHVPLAGHDGRDHQDGGYGGYFNPRAPCGARPAFGIASAHTTPEFQSTCPLRGTTQATAQEAQAAAISIHVPLAGHDVSGAPPRAACGLFQSTCPLRGTTSSAVAFASDRSRFQSACPLQGTTSTKSSS